MFPHKILACMEGPSNLAASQAEIAWLARRLSCGVVIYHATSSSRDGGEELTPAAIRANLVAEIADGPLFAGIDVHVVCDHEPRSLVSGILENADHHGADLVVMPVHRRQGLTRILYRDIVEELVRSCRIAVLTLDLERTPVVPDEAAFDLIVAPTDWSAPARSCTRIAGRFADTLGIPLLLLHALVDIPFTFAYETTASEVRAWVHRAASQKLSDDAKGLIPEGVDWQVRAEIGSVVSVVKDAVAEARNPLVVMSTAGHDSIGDRVLGSRTERMVRTAGCSVLIIPPATLPPEPAAPTG
jgi:nucleotide-binding universal stress UspA family protein